MAENSQKYLQDLMEEILFSETERKKQVSKLLTKHWTPSLIDDIQANRTGRKIDAVVCKERMRHFLSFPSLTLDGRSCFRNQWMGICMDSSWAIRHGFSNFLLRRGLFLNGKFVGNEKVLAFIVRFLQISSIRCEVVEQPI